MRNVSTLCLPRLFACMMCLLEKIACVLALSAWISAVLAIPAFEGVSTWSSIGSLVPGMSYLEALGPTNLNENSSPQYLSIAAPHGSAGNVTIQRDKSPPLFYIHNGQLWHYHNVTTILPINVHNSTLSSQLPLQLIVGDKRDGVKGGSWRWQGTRLFYEQGSTDNQGVYFSCQDTNGLMGLFLFTTPSPNPAGCTLFTVHSFTRR